jgi:hypothetical protein
MDQGLNKSRLGLREPLSVIGVHRNIAESCCAVVLDINIG